MINIAHFLKGILVLILFLGFGAFNEPVFAETVDKMLEEQDQGENTNNAPTEEQPSSAVNTSNTNGPSFLDSLFRILLGLAVVIALIYFISKWAKRKTGFANPNRVISNVGGVPVGQNKQVQIIQVGKQFFLIGIGENVELLTEITDKDTIEQLELNHREITEETKKDSTWNGVDQLLNEELKKMKVSRNKILNNLGKKFHK